MLGLLLYFFATLTDAAPVERYTDVVVPDLHAFQKWQDREGYAEPGPDIFSLVRTPILCTDQVLYATHPQQNTKIYHEYKSGAYKEALLDADSRVCTIRSRFPSNKGRYFCQRADYINTVVISDVYRDRCGKLYRAFWRVTFLQQDDNMGTLSSQGRTLYPDRKSPFPKSIMPGPTYPSSLDRFMFVTAAFEKDQAAILEQQRLAARAHIFHPDTLLFSSRE